MNFEEHNLLSTPLAWKAFLFFFFIISSTYLVNEVVSAKQAGIFVGFIDIIFWSRFIAIGILFKIIVLDSCLCSATINPNGFQYKFYMTNKHRRMLHGEYELKAGKSRSFGFRTLGIKRRKSKWPISFVFHLSEQECDEILKMAQVPKGT